MTGLKNSRTKLVLTLPFCRSARLHDFAEDNKDCNVIIGEKSQKCANNDFTRSKTQSDIINLLKPLRAIGEHVSTPETSWWACGVQMARITTYCQKSILPKSVLFACRRISWFVVVSFPKILKIMCKVFHLWLIFHLDKQKHSSLGPSL